MICQGIDQLTEMSSDQRQGQKTMFQWLNGYIFYQILCIGYNTVWNEFCECMRANTPDSV